MKKLTVDVVLKKLKKLTPNAKCSLDWKTPLDLLVATILSAQCTDKRVNIVTKSLFRKYTSPKDYASVPVRELEQDIHSCGTFHMKALAIQTSCRMILDRFGGEVPRSMPEMLLLRGVGRKTASIVLSTAYGIIEGIPVDTHCIRLSHRLGLTREKLQGKIEADLMKKTPREDWAMLSHLLVAHGRNTCIARSPKCSECVFLKNCPKIGVKR
ncbi:endonuclease III [Candidatus Peribacteria bacterium]|nr:endonuclease III [Candidatus Peribacteria bacterium]